MHVRWTGGARLKELTCEPGFLQVGNRSGAGKRCQRAAAWDHSLFLDILLFYGLGLNYILMVNSVLSDLRGLLVN